MNEEAERPKSTNRFNIKNQSFYGIKQRQVEKDKDVLESFGNTSVMSNVLKMPRKTFASGLQGISSGKEKLKQAIEAKANECDNGQSHDEQKQEELKSEVKALPDHPKTDNNLRTYNMLMEQKRRRRAQHNSQIEDFEGMRKGLIDYNDGERNKVKHDIDQFQLDMDNVTKNYFEQQDVSYLVIREDDLIPEIWENARLKEGEMLDKLQHIRQKLTRLEEDFQSGFDKNVNDLEVDLISIAYLQKPEIHNITEEIRESFKNEVENRIKQNEEYYETVCNNVNERIKKLNDGSAEREAQWRRIKHQEVILIVKFFRLQTNIWKNAKRTSIKIRKIEEVLQKK